MSIFKPIRLATAVLTLASMMVSSVSACSIHDHFCTYHALGTPRTSYQFDDNETRLVIYAKGLSTSHGDEKTDFDNHVLLPTETYTFDWIGSPDPEPTGPYINSRTTYGQQHQSDVSEWDVDYETRGAHVYGSQYEVIFNKNTAKAIHSGDLNGGEKGNTPYQEGCPDYAGANCEAVIITGNVPNGTYSQKVQMFNFYDKDNPAAELGLGAWTTGQGTLVNKNHLNSVNFPGQIEGGIEQGTSSQYNYTTLEGDKAKTAQYDYEFYNRGFNPHAQGVTAWDHNRQYHRSYSDPYKVFNQDTGFYDIKQNVYVKSSIQTTGVNYDGRPKTITSWTPNSLERIDDVRSIGCVGGYSYEATKRCDQDGVIVANNDGTVPKKGLELVSNNLRELETRYNDFQYKKLNEEIFASNNKAYEENLAKITPYPNNDDSFVSEIIQVSFSTYSKGADIINEPIDNAVDWVKEESVKKGSEALVVVNKKIEDFFETDVGQYIAEHSEPTVGYIKEKSEDFANSEFVVNANNKFNEELTAINKTAKDAYTEYEKICKEDSFLGGTCRNTTSFLEAFGSTPGISQVRREGKNTVGDLIFDKKKNSNERNPQDDKDNKNLPNDSHTKRKDNSDNDFSFFQTEILNESKEKFPAPSSLHHEKPKFDTNDISHASNTYKKDFIPTFENINSVGDKDNRNKGVDTNSNSNNFDKKENNTNINESAKSNKTTKTNCIDCDKFSNLYGNSDEILEKGGWINSTTGKVEYIDPFDGKRKEFPSDASATIDHILPKKEIKKIINASNLPPEKKKELIKKFETDPSNLQPLPKNLNSSKGSKIETGTDGWAEYVKENMEINPSYREYLEQTQNVIRQKIKNEIKNELKK